MTRFLESIRTASFNCGGIVFPNLTEGVGVAPTASWGEIHQASLAAAAQLQQAGVRAGSAVGVFGYTQPSLVITIQAIWLAGASVTVLDPHLLDAWGSDDVGASFLAERVAAAGLSTLVITSPLTGKEQAVADLDIRLVVVDPSTVSAAEVPGFNPPRVTETDVAVVQFTSGSTSSPRAVRLSHANLHANIEAIKIRTRHSEVHQCMVSWLPIFHDLGFIGFLTLPMTCGACRLVLSPPEDFVRQPWSWMETISRFRGTATAAPNFAFNLAGRFLLHAELDLSTLRFALTGAEPIDTDALLGFADRASHYGMDSGAIVCAYGMAEATVAVSISPPGRGVAIDKVDTESLERGYVTASRTNGRESRLARLGKPLDGIEARVFDPRTGDGATSRRVGEIEIRGSSVVSTADIDADHDGWLRTGDLGYVSDGELVVCGRSKEIIIIGGRKLFPYEVERLACLVSGVRPGRVAAFRGATRHGSDSLVLAIETDSDDPSSLEREVSDAVAKRSGVRPSEVLSVGKGELPRTSSGKIRRAELSRRYLTETDTSTERVQHA